MKDFKERLSHGPPLILDGGLSAIMIAQGLPAGAPPELWVLEKPGQISTIHHRYVQAGSQALHSCTFGANPLRLSAFGLGHQCQRINTEAIALARESGVRYVLGDIGPTGEYLPPVGTGDQHAWRESFHQQGRIMARAGVDAFHLETMSDLREALIALEALQDAAPGIPIMASLTFDRKPRGFFTIMGDPLLPSLQALADSGAHAVGANCTLTSPDMLELARLATATIRVPLVLQPNAGQPIISSQGIRYDQDPAGYASDAMAMADLGVRVLGGCCGTDPRFIAALQNMLLRQGQA